jgi:putative hydrolase of the HAD superfamily
VNARGVPCRAILLDFFGTLVRYSPNGVAGGYARTHALLRELGAALDYEAFLREWLATSQELERWSAREQREFSMRDVADRFCARAAPQIAAGDARDALWRSYVSDWERGVSYIPGAAERVAGLAARFALAVVTNTHAAELVERHLAALGLRGALRAVVTSIEHGRPKPHPSIYAAALERVGCAPDAALFVGDTLAPDYHGPRAAGLRAVLVDPDGSSGLASNERIASILELPEYLAGV